MFACGSGEIVTVRGGPLLEVRFDGAKAPDAQGAHCRRRLAKGSWDGVVQLFQTCDYEGERAWAVETNGHRPFRGHDLYSSTHADYRCSVVTEVQ